MNVSSKNILVTGATGFIGRAVSEELIRKKNYNVFCLVRNTVKAQSLKARSAHIVTADIRDYGSLNALHLPPVDTVIHCAALVKNCSMKALYPVNVLGVENLCRWMRERGVKKIIHLSSVAAISGNTQMPLNERMPLKASNNYGLSKIEAEKIITRYCRLGLDTIIIRPPMVYGPGEPHLTNTIVSLMKKRILFLPRAGMNKFHLVYLKNLTSAIIFMLENQSCNNETFIVADNEVLNSKEVFSSIAEALGLPRPRVLVPLFESFIARLPLLSNYLEMLGRDRQYCIDKIKSFGFSVPYPVKDSIFFSLKGRIF